MKRIYLFVIGILTVLAVVFEVWAKVLHNEYAHTSIGITVVLEVIIIAIIILTLLMWFNRKKN